MHRIHFLFALTIALLAAPSARAQTLAETNGIWYGTLTVPNIPPLRIVIELYTRPSGVPGAEFISLDEGGNAIVVTEISLEENDLRLFTPRPNLLYTGKVDLEQNRIDGVLHISNTSIALSLERVDTVPNLPRPQLPRPPYPYSEEDVFYEGGADGVRLAGTLTRPAGTGPFPAVFLATGSGPQDRDETIAYHRPFRLLADYLSRRGFAVLRTDDRGWGLSTGNSSTATTKDNTDDALAAVNYLRSRDDIDPERVGIVGHSEGGMIASIAATRDPELAFIVLLAGPGLPPLDDTAVREEQLTSQPQHLSLAQNYPNPFNSGTVISYALETPGLTSLSIYNIAGQLVATLIEGERPAGSYSLHWDAGDDAGQALASGLYFYTLRTPNGAQTRQMMLLR